MRLFAVMGTSSTLLLRAAFCKPWSSIVLFHTDDRNVEIFRNQMRIYSKRNGLALPTIEGYEIPPVDTLNSLSGFMEKIVASMPKNRLQVDDNDVLFYSGIFGEVGEVILICFYMRNASPEHRLLRMSFRGVLVTQPGGVKTVKFGEHIGKPTKINPIILIGGPY